MARLLTPVQIGRIHRESFQATEETAEFDFNLGHNEGVALYTVEFAVREVVIAPAANALETEFMEMSLHAEVGNLEEMEHGTLGDTTVRRSEVIAHATLRATYQEEAATRGGTGVSIDWLSEKRWPYLALIGEPMIVAQNVTLHVVGKASSVMTTNGLSCWLWYRIVELSAPEQVALFALRR